MLFILKTYWLKWTNFKKIKTLIYNQIQIKMSWTNIKESSLGYEYEAIDAVERNDIDLLKNALKNGANPTIPLKNRYGSNALLCAARDKNVFLLDLIFSHLEDKKIYHYMDLSFDKDNYEINNLFLKHKKNNGVKRILTQHLKHLCDIEKFVLTQKSDKSDKSDNYFTENVIYFKDLLTKMDED